MAEKGAKGHHGVTSSHVRKMLSPKVLKYFVAWQTFMVWKNPRVMKRDGEYGRLEEQLTDEMLDKAVRGMLTSTYQNDYMGLPQGERVCT